MDNGLQNGPDGKIYGLTPLCIYRLHPESLAVEEVVRFGERLKGHTAAGPIVGEKIYFSSGHRLLEAKIF